jgi:predicted RNase H-like HicB family nuclease
MTYSEVVVREGRGYWAYCAELPGCVTVGRTRAELDRRFREALDGYLRAVSILAERPGKARGTVRRSIGRIRAVEGVRAVSTRSLAIPGGRSGGRIDRRVTLRAPDEGPSEVENDGLFGPSLLIPPDFWRGTRRRGRRA